MILSYAFCYLFELLDYASRNSRFIPFIRFSSSSFFFLEKKEEKREESRRKNRNEKGQTMSRLYVKQFVQISSKSSLNDDLVLYTPPFTFFNTVPRSIGLLMTCAERRKMDYRKVSILAMISDFKTTYHRSNQVRQPS